MARPARKPYGGAWKRVRLAVLARDGGMCQIRGPRCTKRATEVDHIVPVLSGGDWWDQGNLRASCRACNLARIKRGLPDRWQMGGTEIVLVAGPGGPGLAAYVEEHAGPDDLVIDLPSMEQELGSLDAAIRRRTEQVDMLRLGKSKHRRVWITSDDPNAESIFPHHRVVIIGGVPPGANGAHSGKSAWLDARGGRRSDATSTSRQW